MRYISITIFACLCTLQVYSNDLSIDTTKYVDEIMVYSIDSAKIFANYIKAEPCKQEETSTVVLIIAGSGPTNADGNNPYLKSNTYKYLAEELGRNGISSVRYDKRGIGRSAEHAPKESMLRFETYVNDANEIINGLHEQGYKKIIIIGHSEGSLIGMMVAGKNKYVTKYISIAVPGNSADIILKEQFKAQPEEIAKQASLMIDSVKAGIPIPYVPSYLKAVFRKSVQGYMHSWFQYNPQEEIKKLNIPILILQGTKDLQVQVIDGQQLYLANTKSILKIIENMNHVLRIIESDEKTDNFKSYNNPRLPISDQLQKTVVQFCKE